MCGKNTLIVELLTYFIKDVKQKLNVKKHY